MLGLGDEVAKLKKKAQDTLNNPNKVIEDAKNLAVGIVAGDLSIEALK